MKKIWWILIIGIALRLFLSFSTFHSDLQAFNLAGKIISSGNTLNLYDYLSNLPNNDLVKKIAVLNYPPAIYFFHGAFNLIYTDIFKMSFVNDFLIERADNYRNILFNFHSLFLKLPYLIFDLLTAFILFKLFNSEKQSKIAFTLWIFNPVNLYSTYMMGQFDIIPTFFVIFSLYLAGKSRVNLAALSLGLGIAFKIFPIFLLVPLILLGENYISKIKLFLLSVLPYLLSIVPFINSQGFRQTALVASQSDKSLYALLPVSGGESIFFFPASLIFFYLIIWNRKEKYLWKLYLIPLLLFFVFTHYHPQWLLWITPFLIMNLIFERFKNLLAMLLIVGSWFGSLFFFEPSLTLGLFSPIFPNLYNTYSIWNLLKIDIDYHFSRSILQTVFAASAFYLIYNSSLKSANE